MQKYPNVHLEDGKTWEQKLYSMLRDLEIRLFAVAIEREVVIILLLHKDFYLPPIPKMSSGIFIPVDVTELATQGKYYNPCPLLLI